MANIKNNNFHNLKLKVIGDEYWDFIISKEDTPTNSSSELFEQCLISYIDTDKEQCIDDEKLYSLSEYTWKNAINKGIILNNIGFTGMDNGLIHFQKDRITNDEFYDLLINSKYEINKCDKRLFLTRITGNTQNFIYPYEIIKNENEQYIKLNGGFFQGFFKLHQEDYQTLPEYIENDLHTEFVIRKRNYEESNQTLNNLYPENKGIFFYIGTRAENKFWELYNSDKNQFSINKRKKYIADKYLSEEEYEQSKSNITNINYFGVEPEPDRFVNDNSIDFDYIDTSSCKPITNCNFMIDNSLTWDDPCCCDDDVCCNNLSINQKEKNNSIKIIPNLSYWFYEYGYANSNACPSICCKCNKIKINSPCNDIRSNVISEEKPIQNKKNKCGCNPSPEPKKCNCISGMDITITKAALPNPYWMGNYETTICSNNNENCNSKCSANEYFSDDYFDRCERGCCVDDSKYLLEDEYYMEDMNLDNLLISTYNGLEIDMTAPYEIKSDNKFLLFNQTKTGYTTNNWIDGLTCTFTGRTSNFTGNYYLLMNQTKTGYTTQTIDKYLKNYGNEYDVFKDIYENAFALKINDDGSIGYKLLAFDCDGEDYCSIIEEKSKPNIIKDDEWVVINVRFKILNGLLDNCNAPIGKRKMKIYIYVNGFLIFISKELPELNLRALNDSPEKQEAVPYNISIGGGTQGLIERIWLNYYDVPERVLPIEKNFAGTFIGDFKSFKIYNCFMDYSNIRNNYEYEKNKQ